ncbi:hypothetical protein RB195_007640 [Necator americanus]|uniref:Protein kinase domain-containing protein n=1 Tax=Necator americanus TaxID=51031 RepID=A0ABR1BY70_NECAM
MKETCESEKQKSLINGISTGDTYRTNGLSAGDQLDKLLDQLHSCVLDKPLADDEAGVAFIFTDFTCTELCRSENLRSDAQIITNALIKQGFVMKYMLLSDDKTESDGMCDITLKTPDLDTFIWIFTRSSDLDAPLGRVCLVSSGHRSQYVGCANNLFYACHNMVSTSCDVSVYGNQTVQLIDIMEASTTCSVASTSSPNDNLSAVEMIITIGVPCFCLTIICSVCAVFCYKKSKHSTRQWRTFWQTQSGFRNSEMVTNHPQQSQLTQLPHPASLVMANHYMDIKALAEANKKDPWEVSQQNLYIHENEILGNGAFAVVLKGTLKGKIPLLMVNPRLNICAEHMQDDGPCDTAVKRLPSHANDQNRMEFFQEISFMKNLGYHTHIISMLGCVSCPQNPMILVEYCEYGDLLHFLRNNRNHVIMCKDDVCPTDADICLRIKDLVSIAWQVSDGMTYLSSKNFIHRDVAARNVLLTKQLVAKVSDFGLGRYADSALYTARGGRLPFKSMAVEALKFYEFSEKTDVWAFGILLFEIFSLGDVPYPTVQPTDMISYIEQGNRPPQPEKCPNEIFGLMERCWKAIPDDRPIFAEIRGELTILLNIDDESYGYLSLDSRQLRNMFNRQISELHSNPIKDDNSKELRGKQTTQTNEKNTLVGSGRSNFLTVSPSQDQNIGPNTGAIVSTNSKTAGVTEFDDSTTKYQAQKNSAKPTSFAAKESMTNLRAQSSSNDDIMYKSGMRKNTGDVSILLENIVNFSLQMPEDKRTDCIQSMEQWMNNRLSNGC